jgi:hypothetical protein
MIGGKVLRMIIQALTHTPQVTTHDTVQVLQGLSEGQIIGGEDRAMTTACILTTVTMALIQEVGTQDPQETGGEDPTTIHSIRVAIPTIHPVDLLQVR